MSDAPLRRLPSIDALLRSEGLQLLIEASGRVAVRDRLREVLVELRHEAKSAPSEPLDPSKLITEIEERVALRFARRSLARTQRVVNATGVVLHTNLGRAPLSVNALKAIQEVAGGYCNLEYDLETGTRGRRGTSLEGVLRDIFGCEAAVIVNNCAAAVLITLNTLAEGGEVVVSRGELIEIGGSFRIPDVIAKSGARIREVGTTNRTRLDDYERAITDETRVILRAHLSNYRIVGFTERPSLGELATLARARDLPLFEDLGSGCLLDLSECGITDEPGVADSLKSGASIIAFSGDKLLGGPQAGIVLGEERLIDQIRRNPLMRALRVDKLTFAALEATFASYAAGHAVEEIPAQAMLHLNKDEITQRARRFLRQARRHGKLQLELIDGTSVVGGGSAPQAELPTTLVTVAIEGLTAGQIEARLRERDPPVIARIIDDQLVLDLRTVAEAEEVELLAALGRI
jgi:L-seryl-tRNA(Ser) seleniumtransferase